MDTTRIVMMLYKALKVIVKAIHRVSMLVGK